MLAKIKKNNRYGSAQLFSGHEFVKHEWRRVPAGFEDIAKGHQLLDVIEGKAEKDELKNVEIAAERKVMKARLKADYRDPYIRTLGGKEYVKDEWREVPPGFDEPARAHHSLDIWEAGQPDPDLEPEAEAESENKPRRGRRSKAADAKPVQESPEDDAGELEE